jgi:hypothetical protein
MSYRELFPDCVIFLEILGCVEDLCHLSWSEETKFLESHV